LWTKKRARHEGEASPPEGPAQGPGKSEIGFSDEGSPIRVVT